MKSVQPLNVQDDHSLRRKNLHSTVCSVCVCWFCPNTAQRGRSPEPRLSETSRLQGELPWLPGKSAVQRPQPDTASKTQRPPS